MDNLRVHKVEGVEEMIEAVGARVVYLSPYSPEFNLRRTFMVGTKGIAQEIHTSKCTNSGKLLEMGVKLCSSKQIRNYLAHCYYCTSSSRKVLY